MNKAFLSIESPDLTDITGFFEFNRTLLYAEKAPVRDDFEKIMTKILDSNFGKDVFLNE